MDSASQFSNLIYEYFMLRFHFRYYQSGDILPTIKEICRDFCVSPKTVKAAMRRLQAEGYLSMGNGRYSRVVFQQSDDELKEYTQRFFRERQNAITDLYQSAEIIFIPLLVEGLCQMEEAGFAKLSSFAEDGSSDDLIGFYCFILQKLENPLVMNLFWEAILFQGYSFIIKDMDPAVYDRTPIREALGELIAIVQNKNREELCAALLKLQQIIVEKVINLFALAQKDSIQHIEQISFTWRIYYERPQHCYDLVQRLLYQIYYGEYCGMQYLPSYEKLAKDNQVSVSTMRRTVDLLRDLGAVLPVNGVGIRIFSVGEGICEPNFDSAGIRRNLIYFLQALKIVLHTCKDVTRLVLLEVSRKEKESLVIQLEDHVTTNHCELTLWTLLIFLFRHSTLKVIQEIYRKLYELFLWAYPVNKSSRISSAEEQEIRDYTKNIIKSLQQNHLDQCAALVFQLAEHGSLVADKYLKSRGIFQEDLYFRPSMQFLLKEK